MMMMMICLILVQIHLYHNPASLPLTSAIIPNLKSNNIITGIMPNWTHNPQLGWCIFMLPFVIAKNLHLSTNTIKLPTINKITLAFTSWRELAKPTAIWPVKLNRIFLTLLVIKKLNLINLSILLTKTGRPVNRSTTSIAALQSIITPLSILAKY